MLKRVSGIFLIVLHLNTSTEIAQVLRLPLLIEHFTAHRATDRQLTFFGYLREHYFTDTRNDPDYAADMQLPFKSSQAPITSFHLMTLPAAVMSDCYELRTSEPLIQHTPVYNTWIPRKHCSLIFQPPRA
jgi:hypothetical protein